MIGLVITTYCAVRKHFVNAREFLKKNPDNDDMMRIIINNRTSGEKLNHK